MHSRSVVLRSVLLAAALAVGGCNLFLDADQRVVRANEKLAENDYNGALIELRNAVQSDPKHAQARLLLAQVLLHTGDPASAQRELRAAIDGGAAPQDTAELAARIQLALGRFNEVLAGIDSDELPLEEPLRSGLRGQALLGLQQFDEATAAFKDALAADANDVRAHVGLAQAAGAAGQFELALAELDRALAAEPDNAEAMMVRGVILGRQGDHEQAEKALLAARRSAPAQLTRQQHSGLLAILAETQLARGDIESAAVTQRDFVALAGKTPFGHVLAGRIAMARQDHASAVAEFQHAVNAAPNLVSARFLLGAALLAQGNLNQAEAQLTQVLQKSPDNLEARKLLAQARLRLDRPDAAMQILMPAEQSGDTDAQISTMMGLAHLQLGDETGAIQALESGAAREPDNRRLQFNLAEVNLRSGHVDKALTILNALPVVQNDATREALLTQAIAAKRGTQAAQSQLDELISKYPRHLGLLNLASTFHARLGQIDRARALISKAEAVNAEYVPTQLTAARVELSSGDQAAAAQRLEKVLALQPGNRAAALGLAEIEARGGDFAAAERRLQDLRKREPKAIEPVILLARLHLQQNQPAAADKVLQAAIAAEPNRADLLNAAGLLYLDSGRYDEAAARLRQATAADSSNASYWFNLGRAQLALDRPEAARDALERSLKQRPDSVAAVGALSLLDLRTGKADAAKARLEELQRKRPDDTAVLVLEGDLNMAMKQYAEADRAYGQAAGLRNNPTIALKSYRARQLGKLDNSTEPLTRWLAQHPEDLTLRTVLAEAYTLRGQTAQAIKEYEVIVGSQDRNITALNNLAMLYQQTADSRAEAMAQRAYALVPDHAAVADTYGWILLQAGKATESLPILQKAAQGSTDPEIAFHYAAALARNGQEDEARRRLAALVDGGQPFAAQVQARELLQELQTE